MNNNSNMNVESEQSTVLSIVLRTFVVLVILALAGTVAAYFIYFPAKSEKQEETTTEIITVKTEPIKLSTYPVKIEVMGQVVAAHETMLKARVSGKIINVSENFIPGGLFKKDEEIIFIDPSDYELDLKVKKAAERQAHATLRLELGQQAIAKDELKIIEQTTGKKLTNSDLALRKPQLEQARASLASAKANLELSELNLSRTIVKTPFNALVRERIADTGDVISMQDNLATLVNTDEFWINAEIPVYNTRWLKIPQQNGIKGSNATITMDGGRGTRSGTLLKMTGALDQKSRLARLLISVPDPLLLKQADTHKSPLVLGDFVRVTLIGNNLTDTARIPQSYLRDDQTLWLARNNKLIIQKVFIAYEDRQYAYVTRGLEAGDKVITSNIITPIDGMDITVTTAHNAGQE